MQKKHKIVVTNETGKVWSLPAQLLNDLEISEKDTVILKCGCTTAPARVLTLNSRNFAGTTVMGLSEGLLDALNIPGDISLMIKSLGNKEFRLGPLIGVLTFTNHIPGRLAYYKKYVSTENNRGLLYVFSGQNMDLNRNLIKGYYYDSAIRAWKPSSFPFPDAVMDRCYPSSRKNHENISRVIGSGRIFNNTTRISKLDFFKALYKSSLLRKYLPETRLFGSNNDLADFLAKHDRIFLKPVDSMKGKGIVLVTQADNGLECRYNCDGKDIVKTIPSSESIRKILLTASGSNRRYIIQQAVNCMEYGGGPFSFRTCPMKDGNNKWLMPGMVVIGTMGNSHVTNYASGGKRIPLKDLFHAILPHLSYTKEDFLELLENLSLETARLLDKKHGPLGELGVDLILDVKGKPWLLEANANPARTPAFIQTEYPLWRKQVYEYIMSYANYLAGFST